MRGIEKGQQVFVIVVDQVAKLIEKDLKRHDKDEYIDKNASGLVINMPTLIKWLFVNHLEARTTVRVVGVSITPSFIERTTRQECAVCGIVNLSRLRIDSESPLHLPPRRCVLACSHSRAWRLPRDSSRIDS